MKKLFLFLVIIAAYLLNFSVQDRLTQTHKMELAPLLPAMLQQAALGFLRQLGAEMYFVNAAVFLGTTDSGQDPHEYAPVLSEYFKVASRLHPPFLDTYFFCQSSLSYLGRDYDKIVNNILDTGIKAIPDNWVLPLFAGYNAMHYLNDTAGASDYLHEAGTRPNAPSWIAHLAAILAADSGRIQMGLQWLETVEAREKDETVKKRYQMEIMEFKKACRVAEAIQEYKQRLGTYPTSLNMLSPDFMDQIPRFNLGFKLDWHPPILRLVRPRKSLDNKKRSS